MGSYLTTVSEWVVLESGLLAGSVSSVTNNTQEKVPSVKVEEKVRLLNEYIVELGGAMYGVKQLSDPQEMFKHFFEPLLPDKNTSHNFVLQVRHGFFYEKEGEKYKQKEKDDMQKAFNTWKKENSKFVKIKLIFVQLGSNSFFERFKAGYAFQTTKYGYLHPALQIGPWLIEWNNTCLVIPSPVFKSHQKLLCSLDLKSKIPLNQEKLFQISGILCQWNRDLGYQKNQFKPDLVFTENCGNCHAFVEFLLTKLDASMVPGGPLEYLLNQSKLYPHSETLPFEVFGFPVFSTHQELTKAYNERFSQPPSEDSEDYELHLAFKAVASRFFIKNDIDIASPFNLGTNEYNIFSHLHSHEIENPI